MSYAKFRKELEPLLLESQDFKASQSCPLNHELMGKAIDACEKVVFDRWMEQRRFDELAVWFLANFKSSGGMPYLKELASSLRSSADIKTLEKLMRGAIVDREISYWNWKMMTAAKEAVKMVPELYSQTLRAFDIYRDALDSFEVDDEVAEIEQAKMRFLNGKKSKLTRKKRV